MVVNKLAKAFKTWGIPVTAVITVLLYLVGVSYQTGFWWYFALDPPLSQFGFLSTIFPNRHFLVLAYQGATQLEKFGAEIFVVDLVTIGILREMGVILTAIMVAGRSGSAFAASLGAMKLNEELDALQVMGLSPNQVLVAPRVVGLLIALPLLTGIADVAGLAGGLVLCTTVLDMTATQYVHRAIESASTAHLWVGLSKAPVFALLIAAVGTLRGLQVSGSAEQLGRLTTTAVVQSILLIMLVDAAFTVLFSRLGI